MAKKVVENRQRIVYGSERYALRIVRRVDRKGIGFSMGTTREDLVLTCPQAKRLAAWLVNRIREIEGEA